MKIKRKKERKKERRRRKKKSDLNESLQVGETLVISVAGSLLLVLLMSSYHAYHRLLISFSVDTFHTFFLRQRERERERVAVAVDSR